MKRDNNKCKCGNELNDHNQCEICFIDYDLYDYED